eukprot:gene3551-10827_t
MRYRVTPVGDTDGMQRKLPCRRSLFDGDEQDADDAVLNVDAIALSIGHDFIRNSRQFRGDSACGTGEGMEIPMEARVVRPFVTQKA